MKKTIDMSGMGGGYEHTCQVMLQRGLDFLKTQPDFDFSEYTTYEKVYGICNANGGDSKALDKVITKDLDVTGAMHQAVINHLTYIHKNGYEAWLKEASAKDPARVFEYDGSRASCPQTDISRDMEGPGSSDVAEV